MTRQRGLWAGIFVLAILTIGCSNKNKTLNVEGAYSPVILNLDSDRQPPVRGISNALTAVVQNPRGYTISYHWTAASGVLADSTTQTVHWTPPDSIGVYSVTVSITAYDDLNKVPFFKTRTFQVHVDNQFQRWTRSIGTQYDVAPPAGGKLYYAEIRNPATGESDVWSLDTPFGTPSQVTSGFWQVFQPSVQSDGSRVVFLARKRSTDLRPAIWTVPSAGGDTTNATLVVAQTLAGNNFITSPRFAPVGSVFSYSTDSVGANATRPKVWTRDANLGLQPTPLQSTTNSGTPEALNAYVNAAWRGTGDSVVVESYRNYGTLVQVSRGLVKLSTVGNPPSNPEPFPIWLNDPLALEPDWSPDGQYIVFSKRSPGQLDRDLWIIRSNASDPSAARQITFGPADDFHPRFSSDGTAIYFMSNRIDGYGTNGFYDTERRGTNVWSMSRFDRP